MNDLTAKEARELALALGSLKTDNFLSWVRDLALAGKLSGNYYTAGEHFSEDEMTKLSELGYSLYWNRPCLWYEVSW